MKNEERITLNMSMEDYGYLVNTLKSMQINLAGTNIATTRMSIGIVGSLNILERSQVVLDIWGNIDRAMIKGYVNTLNEAANDIARGKATQQTVMDIKDVASSLNNHMPEEDETDDVLDDHEDRISELYEEVNNIKDLFKSYDNADNALHRRLQFVEDRLDRISDYEKRLTAISNKTDKVYEQNEANDSRITGLHIKLGNKIDILEDRVKNLVKAVGKNECNLNEFKKTMYDRVGKVECDSEKMWDMITGNEDSLDERLETLKHRVDTLEDRSKPHISSVDEIIDAANKFNISPASFSVYFENNKKKEDDDE
jgi:chromosome segregation ATPase